MAEKVNLLESLRIVTEHIFNYVTNLNSETREWVKTEVKFDDYAEKVEEDDVQAILNEVMPIELSIGEELFKIIDTQEEILATYDDIPADRIEMDATMEIATLMPNLYYVFPEMAHLEIKFGAEVDDNNVQEYKFRFTSGATTTNLVLPEGVAYKFEVVPNSVIEISIIDNYAVAQSWAVSEE